MKFLCRLGWHKWQPDSSAPSRLPEGLPAFASAAAAGGWIRQRAR